MAEKIKKTSITVPRSSYREDMDTLVLRGINKPYTRDVDVDGVMTTVTSTKVKVLNDKHDEFITISVQKGLKAEDFQIGQTVEFLNLEEVIQSEGRNGWQNQPAQTWLDTTFRASDMIVTKDSKAEQSKVENKPNKV